MVQQPEVGSGWTPITDDEDVTRDKDVPPPPPPPPEVTEASFPAVGNADPLISSPREEALGLSSVSHTGSFRSLFCSATLEKEIRNQKSVWISTFLRGTSTV